MPALEDGGVGSEDRVLQHVARLFEGFRRLQVPDDGLHGQLACHFAMGEAAHPIRDQPGIVIAALAFNRRNGGVVFVIGSDPANVASADSLEGHAHC